MIKRNEIAYAGEDGWEPMPIEIGVEAYTTHPDLGYLIPVKVIGKGSNFDQYQIWRFVWVNGPDAGKSFEAYGRGLWQRVK